jgi:hypothetical protein
MELSKEQADLVEEALSGPAWAALSEVLTERLEAQLRKLRSGSLTHDQYIALCESIRTTEYLRDRPQQLVEKARSGSA